MTLIFRGTKKTPTRAQSQSEIEAWLRAARQPQPHPIRLTVYVTAKDYGSIKRCFETQSNLLPPYSSVTFPKQVSEFWVSILRHRLTVKVFEEKKA